MSVVVTVTGETASEEIGLTLPHEHLFIDLVRPNYSPPEGPSELHLGSDPVTLANRDWVAEHWTSNRDNLLLDDVDLAVAELEPFRDSGGVSLVDVTSEGIGRTPKRLVEVAERSGISVVMGAGYYVDGTYPRGVRGRSELEITQGLVREWRNGVGRSGIRPGIIGEIGCSWPLTPSEREILRAAARAQQELGCGLTIHPGRHQDAPTEILEVVESAGGTLSRVIICHIERTTFDLKRLNSLATSGCYLEYDLFGMEMPNAYFARLGIELPTDTGRIAQITELVSRGWCSQILISHDIASKHRLRRYGGHGYGYIPSVVIPAMLEGGLSAADIAEITVENPRRALEVG